MPARLILIKHSQPEVQPGTAPADWRLGVAGRERARRLAGKLAARGPRAIVHSLEPKAAETAEILGSLLNLPPAAWQGLHKQERGAIPFLEREAFEASIRQLFEKPGELVFGNETADQAHARFDAALNAALRKHADERLAVVSHGTVTALYVSRRAGVPAFPLWQSLGMPSFVVLERDGRPPAIQNLE